MTKSPEELSEQLEKIDASLRQHSDQVNTTEAAFQEAAGKRRELRKKLEETAVARNVIDAEFLALGFTLVVGMPIIQSAAAISRSVFTASATASRATADSNAHRYKPLRQCRQQLIIVNVFFGRLATLLQCENQRLARCSPPPFVGGVGRNPQVFQSRPTRTLAQVKRSNMTRLS